MLAHLCLHLCYQKQQSDQSTYSCYLENKVLYAHSGSNNLCETDPGTHAQLTAMLLEVRDV